MLSHVPGRRGLMRLALALAIALSVHGQAAPQAAQERVFTFRTGVDAEFREISQTFTAIIGSQPAAVDAGAHNITVRGTPAELAFAEWLAARLDAPAGANEPVERFQYGSAPDGATAARLFTLRTNATAQQTTELTNLIRSLAQINRVMPSFSRKTIVLRGKPADADLAEWIVNAVEDVRDQAEPVRFTDAGGGKDTDVRAFFLPRIPSAQALAELVNVVRSLTQINRMMSLSEPKCLFIRATPEQAALAQWIAGELGDPSTGATKPRVSSYEFSYPYSDASPRMAEFSAVRVIRPAGPPSSSDLTQLVYRIRAESKVNNLMVMNASSAIALLGTPQQAAQAERIMEEWNHAHLGTVPAPTGAR